LKDLRAYKIMFQLLKDRYFRGPSDELGGLLSSLTLLQDGGPADAAMVEDWERAIGAVDSRDPTNLGEGLFPKKK
jgi:hypothetical protein